MKKILFTILVSIISTGLFGQINMESIEEKIKIFEEKLKTEPENLNLLLNLGISYQQLGAAGDKDAVKKADSYLKKAVKLEPDNSEAHCWYGCVLTLKGRDAWMPISKMKYVNDGLKEMDKAVTLSPHNVTIRLTRANTCLNLPGFFHRIDTAAVDFSHLLNLKKKNSMIFDAAKTAQIYMNMGDIYMKKGEIETARENWKKTVKTAPDSKAAEKAEKMLNKTEG